MIIKIHSRGVGCGSGPVDYLLGKERDREDARLDRGNPDEMVELIDSSPYAQKYKSGVLSFAERDLEEHQKQEIMDSFEQTLMAGLDKDQYAILWVQHQDKDRLELNFVVANTELHSGKRLQPYYDPVDRPRLDAWKDLVNDRYELHDPNDPINKKELCTPNNLPRTKIQACETITNGLLNLAEQGKITNREDVVQNLEQAGFEIARTTPKSISLKNPDGGQNIRLKGAIYEQDFRFSKELRADIERASQAYRDSRKQRVQETRATLDRLTQRKRESNQQRYPRTEQTPTPDYIKNLEHRSNRHHHRTAFDVGLNDLSELQNQKQYGADRTTRGNTPTLERERGQYSISELYRQEKPQTPMRFSEQGRRNLGEWQPNDTNGILTDDRTRKTTDNRPRTDATTAPRRTYSFASDVREYQAGQSADKKQLQDVFNTANRDRANTEQIHQQFDRTRQLFDEASTRLRDANKQTQEKLKTQTRSRGMEL